MTSSSVVGVGVGGVGWKEGCGGGGVVVMVEGQ